MSGNSLLITYDLRKPGQNYTTLIKQIKSLGSSWIHPLESVWVVKASMRSGAARDVLKAHIDGNDKLWVVNVSGDGWASIRLDAADTDWLKANL
ncbi:SinR family protein [Streptomyces sp. SID14515]|uniref:SinR family protein n=1 Tax=Streptomyces sp. SID14515 TaxID=2706074 RepID=UPI0013C74174|nr:SinR family protein [Streptomyces sp. SID14515]NEB39184.1 SinR family protein [Streptomyces sp. SID14515]